MGEITRLRIVIILLILAGLAGCNPAPEIQPVVSYANLTPYNTALPAHPSPTLAQIYTPTPSAIPSITPIPSDTPLPSATPLASPTPTIPPTATPTATATLTFTPPPTITATIPPPPTLDPALTGNEDEVTYTVYLSGIGPYTREIYLRGQSLGKRRNAFSKVGDSETWSNNYLYPFEKHYNLGPYAHLQPTVDYYRGSFSRSGQAARPGFPAEAYTKTTFTNPYQCEKGETPLMCEYRQHKPAIALIMVRTWSDYSSESEFHQALRQIVEYSIEEGVIPVLSTVPHMYPTWPPAEPINEIIRSVAREYNVPLWDLILTTDTLPYYGVTPTTNHLSIPPDNIVADFSGAYQEYGIVRHNLEALEVLHILLNYVMFP